LQKTISKLNIAETEPQQEERLDAQEQVDIGDMVEEIKPE